MSTFTFSQARSQIEYPESNGKPLAETDAHIQAIIDAIETLADFFRNDPQVYVAGNLLMYYEEGNPAASIAPDVFVVRGVPKTARRVYKLWEEGHPPTMVLEITSRSTRVEDSGNKRFLYALLGVREYFLYDPLGEYLDPPLQGFELSQREYAPLAPEADGSLACRTLRLKLVIEAGQLRFSDLATGQRLLRPAEAQEQARLEAEARRAAEQRLADAEAELARLRAELARLRGETPPGG